MVQNQEILLPILSEKKISLFVKREDLVHPQISGNKFRKLKYNLIAADKQAIKTILTFGGAYSNHIAATAYACKKNGLKSIGIIRGKELAESYLENSTLSLAKKNGMLLKFVSRKEYRRKNDSDFLSELKAEFGSFYFLPEGGTNALAIKGCEEILEPSDSEFNLICCAVGTGGTVSGIINSSMAEQRVLGFSALKGDFLKEDIRKFVTKKNWNLIADYHFGGYAKTTSELISFINDFEKKSSIPLDPIYTGKMVFGILDLIKKDKIKSGAKILVIHTGGLQGIQGVNRILQKKNKPLINYD